METVYRFFKVYSGVSHFAEVAILTAQPSLSPSVLVAISEPANAGEGEVTAQSHPDWVRAAESGVREALLNIQSAKGLDSVPVVKIIRVVGVETDTRPDAVKCAAFLATWRAVAAGLGEPMVEYRNGWQVIAPQS